MEDLKNTVI